MTLVGVFPSAQVVVAPDSPWPILLRLATYFQFLLEPLERIPTTFEFTLVRDRSIISTAAGGISVKDPTSPVVVTIATLLPIAAPGDVEIRLRFGDKEGPIPNDEVVKTLKVSTSP
jgi:hypothetical protein